MSELHRAEVHDDERKAAVAAARANDEAGFVALIERFWWGSVFLIAVPIMGLLLVLGPRLLPEHRDPDARPLDIASAALSLVAVLALVYGVKALATDGWGWQAAAPIATALAVGAAPELNRCGL